MSHAESVHTQILRHVTREDGFRCKFSRNSNTIRVVLFYFIQSNLGIICEIVLCIVLHDLPLIANWSTLFHRYICSTVDDYFLHRPMSPCKHRQTAWAFG